MGLADVEDWSVASGDWPFASGLLSAVTAPASVMGDTHPATTGRNIWLVHHSLMRDCPVEALEMGKQGARLGEEVNPLDILLAGTGY